ncbi:MAG: DUF5011 domain-containing protein [Clostridiales bacterium]|nr:DUF5011 domain-containing protein [Clostridiales bacterium]
MEKIIQRICIVAFGVSLAVFGVVSLYRLLTTDSRGPTITMDSQEVTVSVADGDAAILEGVTAQDGTDGDVTDSLVVERMSNFITDGVREATIAAFDSAGNVTKVTRQVVYSDYTAPTVTLSGPLAASTNDTGALLDVLTVTDCLDGDLTGQVQIIFDDNTQSVSAGEFAMRIQVSNSAGDTLDLPVTVRFYSASDETETPRLTLTDYLIYVEQGTEVDPEDYLDTITVGYTTYTWSAASNAFLSGDDTETIRRYFVKVNDETDTSTPGVYEIAYSYTDRDSGLTGTVRLIVIVEEG